MRKRQGTIIFFMLMIIFATDITVLAMETEITELGMETEIIPSEDKNDNDEITLFYEYATSVTPSLSISSGKASYSCVVYGSSKVTKVEGTIYLQRRSKGSTGGWSTYSTKSQNSTGTSWTATDSQSVSSGYEYKTYAILKVYSGSKYETITSGNVVITY